MQRTTLALLILAALPAVPETNVPKTDLSFMTGHWRTEAMDGIGEEFWSSRSEGNMIGMWRFQKEGKLVFTEFMSLEESPEGTVLWMRHFRGQLKAVEDKENAIQFKVAEFKPNEVVFETGATKLRYRLESPDVLVATLEKTKDGKTDSTIFRFSRVK